MDFGSILDKWEKKTAGADAPQQSAGRDMVQDREAGERRYRLLRRKPEASIDLHGLKRDEAVSALGDFFENSRREGYEKLLIIHGKGNHSGSGEEGVLRDLARRFIETCPYAGESGHSSARDGGTGATWVILKEQGKL